MSGRFAVINGLFIAPNLLHHAVELLIKYTLLKDAPESQRSAATAQLGFDGHREEVAMCRNAVVGPPGHFQGRDHSGSRPGSGGRHQLPLAPPGSSSRYTSPLPSGSAKKNIGG